VSVPASRSGWPTSSRTRIVRRHPRDVPPWSAGWRCWARGVAAPGRLSARWNRRLLEAARPCSAWTSGLFSPPSDLGCLSWAFGTSNPARSGGHPRRRAGARATRTPTLDCSGARQEHEGRVPRRRSRGGPSVVEVRLDWRRDLRGRHAADREACGRAPTTSPRRCSSRAAAGIAEFLERVARRRASGPGATFARHEALPRPPPPSTRGTLLL